jgi:hypothetical protein
VTRFAFVVARLVGLFFAGVAVVGVADRGSLSGSGADFGFDINSAAGGFAGGLGAGLSRRVVMARASRAGLDPGLDQ